MFCWVFYKHSCIKICLNINKIMFIKGTRHVANTQAPDHARVSMSQYYSAGFCSSTWEYPSFIFPSVLLRSFFLLIPSFTKIIFFGRNVEEIYGSRVSEGTKWIVKGKREFCNLNILKFVESFSNLRVPWPDSWRHITPSLYQIQPFSFIHFCSLFSSYRQRWRQEGK